MIRIIIADDSPTQRLLVRSILESDPDFFVVGEARNGQEATQMCQRLKPDIVTMDINMPVMDGYQAIQYIMSESPCPIVVLTGIDTQQMIAVSFKALSLGALTVLSKPRGMPDKDPDAYNLITQVKLMASIKVIHRVLAPTKLPSINNTRPGLWSKQNPISPKLVAIGVSTGGPPTLQRLFKGLDSDFPLPIIVVQHISPGFISGLAHWLSDTTQLECKVAEQGEDLKPGKVYFAPDNMHLTITLNYKVWLEDTNNLRGLRPSVNTLFESISKNLGSHAIGVLLTGMGEDGAQGLLAMRKSGAYTIVQDEASSIVFGMPKAAIDLGATDEIISLDSIATRLITLAGNNQGMYWR